MRIYLDEDLAQSLLTRLLETAGHDVESPTSVGMLGRSDPAQLTHSIRQSRVCLSANYEDYEELHLLVEASQGIHPGILVVRRESNPARNMTPKASSPPFASWRQQVCRLRMNTSC